MANYMHMEPVLAQFLKWAQSKRLKMQNKQIQRTQKAAPLIKMLYGIVEKRCLYRLRFKTTRKKCDGGALRM